MSQSVRHLQFVLCICLAVCTSECCTESGSSKSKPRRPHADRTVSSGLMLSPVAPEHILFRSRRASRLSHSRSHQRGLFVVLSLLSQAILLPLLSLLLAWHDQLVVRQVLFISRCCVKHGGFFCCLPVSWKNHSVVFHLVLGV